MAKKKQTEAERIKADAEEREIERIAMGQKRVHDEPPTEAVDLDKPIEFTPTEPAHDSPEALAKYDAKTVVLANRQTQFIRQCEISEDESHEIYAQRKKERERAEEYLVELLERRAKQRGQPVQAELFDGADPHAVEGLTDSPDKDKTPDEWAAGRVADAPGSDAWKTTPLRELVEKDGLLAKVCEILESHGLDTVGKVAEYVQPNASGYVKHLTDLKGFGPKKQEQYDDANALFWARRSRESAAGTGSGVGAAGAGDAGESVCGADFSGTDPEYDYGG